ncbi:hypothetical protein ACOME3_002882 [Neoechinorhynchus agilis]
MSEQVPAMNKRNIRAGVKRTALAIRNESSNSIEGECTTRNTIPRPHAYRNPHIAGTNPIQLWQFLLELLKNPAFATIIRWEGTNGEFKLIEPDEVARKWGERKGKPNMNYDKLSRALRYYYDKNIMTKVHGRRYAYRFDFDGLSQIHQNATSYSGYRFRSPLMSSSYEDHYLHLNNSIMRHSCTPKIESSPRSPSRSTNLQFASSVFDPYNAGYWTVPAAAAYNYNISTVTHHTHQMTAAVPVPNPMAAAVARAAYLPSNFWPEQQNLNFSCQAMPRAFPSDAF